MHILREFSLFSKDQPHNKDNGEDQKDRRVGHLEDGERCCIGGHLGSEFVFVLFLIIECAFILGATTSIDDEKCEK